MIFGLVFALSCTGSVSPSGGKAVPVAGDTGTDGDTDPSDTGTSDTGTADTGTADTGTADTGTADTGTADTGTADTGTADTGLAECVSCPASTASAALSLGAEVLTPDAARTRDNPLKGFLTSYLWGEPVTDFPDQMEFLYLPMNTLWDASGATLEEGLEPYMVEAEARGHHVVLRVFLDYPSRDPGLPDHLADLVSCEPYTDHGGGCSPDYDDPDLVAAMLGLIEALGAAYDGDARLGFVQVGLLGFWGEWHTWPHTDWFPSDETQRAVLDAYVDAFPTTPLQIRRAAVHATELPMGFHDDSFAYSTIGDVDWFFLPGLEAAGGAERWQEVPIGGELRPELQGEVFSDDYELGTYAQDVNECIDATHASYLLNYHAFNGGGTGYTGVERDRAEAAALRMGYQFELTEVTLSVSDLDAGFVQASVEAQISNSGVAPFYSPVFLMLSADGLDEPALGGDDLRDLLPGDTRTVAFDLGTVPVSLLHGPVSLELTSDVLLATQQLSLATHTPWSDPTGPTTVQWDLQCDTDAGTFNAGDTVATLPTGCDCVCDVDGVARTCGGAVCTPDSM